ncbi:MAG TPA: hypothetical protein VER79_04435, partial [Candidatus Limnocylindrales bacterium]|nr:hypothetical protein [Candidatus Limnocylindrales bacterium]
IGYAIITVMQSLVFTLTAAALLVLAACTPETVVIVPTVVALPSATVTPSSTLAPPTQLATALAQVATETTPPPTDASTATPPPVETAAFTLTAIPPTAVHTEPPTVTPSLTITNTITPTPSETLTPTLDAGGFSALVDLAARITVQPPEVRYGPGTATALWEIGNQAAGTALAAQPTAPPAASTADGPSVIVIGTVSGGSGGVPGACTAPPAGALGALLSSDSAFSAQLGCATGAPVEIAGAFQLFERGLMIYRASSVPGAPGTIEAISNDGRFSRYADTWVSGIDPDSVGLVPPPGLVEPIRGFGKVWRGDGALPARLGWALTSEQGVPLTVQPFERGVAIYLPAQNLIYVLASDGPGAPSGSWRQVSGGF